MFFNERSLPGSLFVKLRRLADNDHGHGLECIYIACGPDLDGPDKRIVLRFFTLTDGPDNNGGVEQAGVFPDVDDVTNFDIEFCRQHIYSCLVIADSLEDGVNVRLSDGNGQLGSRVCHESDLCGPVIKLYDGPDNSIVSQNKLTLVEAVFATAVYNHICPLSVYEEGQDISGDKIRSVPGVTAGDLVEFFETLTLLVQQLDVIGQMIAELNIFVGVEKVGLVFGFWFWVRQFIAKSERGFEDAYKSKLKF